MKSDTGYHFPLVDNPFSLVTQEVHGLKSLYPGKSNLSFELSGRAGDCSRVTEGQKRPHLGLFPGPDLSGQRCGFMGGKQRQASRRWC